MAFIHLTNFVAAPIERVFDLSRSIDLHKASMKKYNESVIEGKSSGLLDLADTVTWSARHLLRQRMLQVRMAQLQRPLFFADEQVSGPFKMMKHEHYFKPVENGTIMIDQFHFELPHGFFGQVFDNLYLRKYMTRLLQERNKMIRQVAEGNLWNQYLKE